ncbi:MAG: 3-dehydroquinate synthase [Verrucomicrobia bacterium]|nr:3-dehydroquinate synthase [Verrucomicrobiota bacterium]
MRVVKVPLGDRTYSILIGEGLLARLGMECRRLKLGRRCALITDANVAPLFAAAAEESLSAAGFESLRITVPAGETAKRLRTVQACYDQLAAHRLERKSFVVALGGGVVGDLAGFVAATYLRGLAFVQVPTTLLAQVDSSVGGKVGVNLKAGKNLVGAFYQPKLVLCDLGTLRTLPQREFRAGLAEVVKYGVIYDAALFRRLERNMEKLVGLDPATLTAVVARCCQIKAEVVGQDETESGLRAILNFGHTIGHAIENSVGYGKYLHGEAIAIGQTAAAELSRHLLGLPERDVIRIGNLLCAAGLPNRIRLTAAQTTRLFEAMKLDKKVSGGEIKFVLARRIGEVLWGQKVPAELLDRVLGRSEAHAP